MELNAITVSGAELARAVGVSRSAVSMCKWAVRSADGGFLLLPSFLAYATMLRKQRGLEETPENELENELMRWKIQTEKRKDEEWQRLKCREMCEGILAGLRDDVSRLREAIAARPDAAEIVALIEQVRQDLDGMDAEDFINTGDGEDLTG